MNDHNSDPSLREAFRILERQSPVSAGAKERARERALAAFDGLSSQALGHDAEVLDLVAERSAMPRTLPAKRRLSWLAAAAVGVIALGSLVWLAGSSQTDVTRIADAEELDEGPILLPSGEFSSDVLGTSVSFQSDGTLWLIDEAPGRIAFSADPSDPAASTIQLMRPTGLAAEFDGSSLTTLFDGTDPRFGAQYQPTTVGGVDTLSWRVRLSSESGLTDGCAEDLPCVQLFEAPASGQLVRTRWNDLFEIAQGDESPIVILSNPAVADTVLTYGEPFEPLIDSLEFGSPQPNPID